MDKKIIRIKELIREQTAHIVKVEYLEVVICADFIMVKKVWKDGSIITAEVKDLDDAIDYLSSMPFFLYEEPTS